MTEQQVSSLLGEPTEIRFRSNTRLQGPVVKVHQWTQAKPEGSIEVHFSDGLSIAKSTTFPAPPPPKKDPGPDPALAFPGTRLTRANYEKIKSGMTEEEVVEILGRPGGQGTSTVTGSTGITTVTRHLTWRLGEPRTQLDRYFGSLPRGLTITVTLTNGRVSGQNWMWVGPRPKT